MKCDLCNGTGRLLKPWYDTTGLMTGFTGDVCFVCDGKGTIGEPMTNEEYIRSCSTEELPKALKEMFFDIKSRVRSELGGYNELMKSERYFDEWLKEKHHE